MFIYGFELEGFYNPDGTIAPPPASYPVDGFPGLIELRTTGGQSLDRCFSELVRQRLETPGADFATSSHTFSRADKQVLRRRHEVKSSYDVQNLYGKLPRHLGNKTIASFQINISNQLYAGYVGAKGDNIPAAYGLIDTAAIVARLDKEFGTEIRDAGRQIGEYCVKDSIRLEYRSLPNSVFSWNFSSAKTLLARIKNAVEG